MSPMTSDQYRAAYTVLGVTQVGIAELLRVDARTSRRWALGERAIPDSVQLILRLLVAGVVTPDNLRDVASRPFEDLVGGRAVQVRTRTRPM